MRNSDRIANTDAAFLGCIVLALVAFLLVSSIAMATVML